MTDEETADAASSVDDLKIMLLPPVYFTSQLQASSQLQAIPLKMPFTLPADCKRTLCTNENTGILQPSLCSICAWTIPEGFRRLLGLLACPPGSSWGHLQHLAILGT
jgi:hypothetical protein